MPAGHDTRDGGFTIIEIMVVVAIIALVVQIVVLNMGAMIPSTILDGESKRFLANLDFIRSEARLNGKSYSVEIDLDNQRWRIVMPPEEQLVSSQTIEESVAVSWTDIDERAKIASLTVAGGSVMQTGKAFIVFDENGFTADQFIIFKLRDTESQYVWTLQIHGLTGQAELFTDVNDKPRPMELVQEHQF